MPTVCIKHMQLKVWCVHSSVKVEKTHKEHIFLLCKNTVFDCRSLMHCFSGWITQYISFSKRNCSSRQSCLYTQDSGPTTPEFLYLITNFIATSIIQHVVQKAWVCFQFSLHSVVFSTKTNSLTNQKQT